MNEINVFDCALKAKPQNGEIIELGLAAKLVFPQLLGGTSVCRAGGVAGRKFIEKPADIQLLDTAIYALQKENIQTIRNNYLGLCTEPFAEQLIDLYPDVKAGGGVFRYRQLLIQPVNYYVYGYSAGVVFGKGAFAVGSPLLYNLETHNPILDSSTECCQSFWCVPAHIINFNAIVRMEAVLPDWVTNNEIKENL